MKHFLLLLALLCGVSAPLSAQRNRKPINNTHEIRLGAYALTPFLMEFGDAYVSDPASKIFNDSKLVEGDHININAKAVTYTYRTSRAMEYGAQLSYSGSFVPYFSTLTGERTHIASGQYVTLMPYARATWLNKPWVRLYSSLAIGFTMVFDQGKQSDFGGAFQLTPVGITVGRELFGFGELLTIGSNGFATLGIGYRF